MKTKEEAAADEFVQRTRHVVTYFSWDIGRYGVKCDVPPPDQLTRWRMVTSNIEPVRDGMRVVVTVWERIEESS